MGTSLMGRKTTVEPGDTVLMRIARCEVTDHMRVAAKLMPVQVIAGGRYPAAQILGDFADPFGGPVALHEAGLHTDDDGVIHSDAIVATHVAWAPNASPGKFYVFSDGRMVPDPFRLFEEARDEARRTGGEVRHADNRLMPPFWTRFAPVSPDAEVTYRYVVQGRNSESRPTLFSEKYTDFTTDEQAVGAARRLAAGWGYAQAARDVHVLDDTGVKSYYFGGRQTLWQG
ncbi:hypothetical protein PUR49_08210 [Streptomyces sp. BE147]|uniref:hypothetical protein n=1 Tax=Streptomyces sp. BE147 TaxID=3002524 RepID=UPI002E7A49EC|nr:hypothetical protein [Streptomyces sp. BE147]MEE1736482.1 hypothetical protein [Streptomyces sp. BE147]